MAKEVVFGRHPVLEVLKAGRRKVEALFVAAEAARKMPDIIGLAEKKQIPVKNASNHQLEQRSHGGLHQGVLAVVDPLVMHELDFFIDLVRGKSPTPVVVVLDSIEDPHNFGAIIRSAETFGLAGAIFPKDRSCDINSTVVKTSAGATEHMDFCRVTNIAETLRQLKREGFYCIAAEAEGTERLWDLSPAFPLAVVVGSEGKAVRPLVKKNCDAVVSIPLRGKVNSLNASNAAAVFFYEISKHLG